MALNATTLQGFTFNPTTLVMAVVDSQPSVSVQAWLVTNTTTPTVACLTRNFQGALGSQLCCQQSGSQRQCVSNTAFEFDLQMTRTTAADGG